MLQVEIVTGMTAEELKANINTFIATLQDDAVKDIKVEASEGIATILYVIQDEWKKHMCCDCQYWDDQGDNESTSGLCHECGQRRRFNCKACKYFKDIRG